jgi:long-chain acyl-CoA synthetase
VVDTSNAGHTTNAPASSAARAASTPPGARRQAGDPSIHFPEVTLAELFRRSVERDPETEAIRFKSGGVYQSLSYAELATRVRQLGLALVELGIGKGDRIAILAENRPEWVITDLSAVSMGAVVVPIYPTLPPSQVEYILRDAGARILFVSDSKQLEKALSIHPNLPVLSRIVVMDPPAELPGETMTFTALLERSDSIPDGEARWRELTKAVQPADLASIVYTSGTTGEPKGAMLTHRNFTSNVQAVQQRFEVRPDDLLLSYIPLSHIFSRLVNYLVLACGATTAFAESIFTVATNLTEVRPTLMPSIPRLFESMQSRILSAANRQSLFRRRLFHWALGVGDAYGERKVAGHFIPPWLAVAHRVADRLVLRRVREQTGGRIRLLLSGGSALAPETARFFNSLGLLIVEGYGLTETSPVIAFNPPECVEFGTVGPPVDGVEVRIAEDGEILCRGPNVMQGYYNKPEETREAIDVDGWFHTGDIGELDEEGYLRITDRKKEILVLSNGKNVAPQAVERALKASRYIAEAAVFGDHLPVVVALVVPDFAQVKTWGGERGLQLGNNAEIAASPEVRRLLKAEIDAHSAGLADFERVRRFAILDRDFSLEKGELTPTLKLKRRVVAEHFADQLQPLYRSEKE